MRDDLLVANPTREINHQRLNVIERGKGELRGGPIAVAGVLCRGQFRVGHGKRRWTHIQTDGRNAATAPRKMHAGVRGQGLFRAEGLQKQTK